MYTSDDLIAAVKSAGFLPDASDLTDVELLGFADEAMTTFVGDALEKQCAEHWWASEDTSLVPGVTAYRLPRRLFGRAVRGVAIVDTRGDECPLDELDPIEMRSAFRAGSVGTPTHFAFEGDLVRLGQVPASAGVTLRIHYVRRPSRLVSVSTTEMARIYQAVNTTTLNLIETAPSTNLTAEGALLDIVRGSEPYDLVAVDRLSADDFAAPAFVLQPSTPIVVADFETLTSPLAPGAEPAWLVQRDQTPLPQIPNTMWSALVDHVLAAALGAVRDPQAQAIFARGQAKLGTALSIAKPRDKRNTKRIVGSTPLRRAVRGGVWR